MANQDLSVSITQRLANGETRESIKQNLLSKGWRADEIDTVFAGIPGQQNQNGTASDPVPLPFSSLISTWDAKTSNLPATIVMGVFGLIAFLILLVAIVLYNMLDPLGSKAVSRDTLRESEFNQTQTALQRYFDQHQSYPHSLSLLVPAFLTRVPLDPSSGNPLKYSFLEDNANYQLCVDYETKQIACATSSNASQSQVVAPTDMPVSPSAMITPAAYSVTGLVFIDYNENGIQDTGDPVFFEAGVSVVDASNKTVCSVKTDSTGHFICPVPNLGDYQVFLTIPLRYRITIANPQAVTLSIKSPTASTKFGLVPIDSITSHDSTSTDSGGAR